MTRLQDRLKNCYKVQKTSENQQVTAKSATKVVPKINSSKSQDGQNGTEEAESKQGSFIENPFNLRSNPFMNNWKDYDSNLNLRQINIEKKLSFTPITSAEDQN